MIEEKIILEISPIIDIDDHIELKYNLSSLMSGFSSRDSFQVNISDDSFANVSYKDSKFEIDLIEGRNVYSTNVASFEDAMKVIFGEFIIESKNIEEDDLIQEKIEENLDELDRIYEFFKDLTRDELSEDDIWRIFYKSNDLKDIFYKLIST